MKLPSRLRFIYACIFLDALGIGLIIPVLPRLIGVLTDTRDEQMWWYGAIMLSYGVMQFLASPLLGALSDRIGRRPVLLSGICGLGIMFAVPALSTSLTAILASRIFGGLLSANISVAQAYIADVTTGYERAAAFGRIGAVFGAGFLIGPALGGILGGNNPHLPFIAASIVTLLNFGYGLFVLPESIAQRSTEPVSLRKNNAFGSLAHLLKLPQIRIFVLTLAFFSLANSLMQYSWALYTEFRYGFIFLGALHRVSLRLYTAGNRAHHFRFKSGHRRRAGLFPATITALHFSRQTHANEPCFGRSTVNRRRPESHRTDSRHLLLPVCPFGLGYAVAVGRCQPTHAHERARSHHGHSELHSLPHGSYRSGLYYTHVDVRRASSR